MAKKDEDLALSNYRRYQRARDNGHTDYLDMADKCNRFYLGDQWDEEDLKILQEQGKPALTINQILPTVNTVLGEQANKRAEIRFVPRNDSPQQIADVLSKVMQQIMDNNNYDYVESQVFADGIIEERGYFEVRMDTSDNIYGEVRITSVDPRTVLLDPDAREYDPSTWSEVIVSKWMSTSEISLLYGEKIAKQLKETAILSTAYGADSVEYSKEDSFGDIDPATDEQLSMMTDKEGRTITRVRVIDRQYKRMDRVRLFVDPNNGDTRPVPKDWSEEKVMMLKEKAGLLITNRFQQRIRHTVTADTTVLHDDWSPYSFFTIVPYFPYFRRGRPMGLIRNLLSPQEQYNKIKSQELHIVNTTANSGYIVEQGSLTNMTTEDLATRGAETGIVIEVAPGTNGLQKIQPNQIPTGLDRIGQKAAMDIKQISGITDAMLGTDSPNVSGRALETKLSRGMIPLQVPFDNLNRSRAILAKHILTLVQMYYTEERVIHIVDPVNQEQQESVAINKQDPVTGQIINNVTLGEYGVTVSSVPSRANFNDTQFAEAIVMRNAGVMVPDDVVVRYSTLENKAEIADRIKRMMGQADPTPEEQQMMAQQQQIQMQMTQLQMQELQAKIQNLAAQAELAMAKAKDTEFDADQYQLELLKIQADLAKAQTTLDSKKEIANMQARLAAQRGDAKGPQGQVGRYNQVRSAAAPGGRSN
jgi:hypothetical protein